MKNIVISSIKEYRGPTFRPPCDVIGDVIIMKKAFYGIIWDDLANAGDNQRNLFAISILCHCVFIIFMYFVLYICVALAERVFVRVVPIDFLNFEYW